MATGDAAGWLRAEARGTHPSQSSLSTPEYYSEHGDAHYEGLGAVEGVLGGPRGADSGDVPSWLVGCDQDEPYRKNGCDGNRQGHDEPLDPGWLLSLHAHALYRKDVLRAADGAGHASDVGCQCNACTDPDDSDRLLGPGNEIKC